jgi:hypothetical protein
MPDMNKKLFDAINKPEFLQKGEAARRALDELIAVDSTDLVKFRVAVTKHRALWEQMGIKPDTVLINWIDTKPTGLGDGGADDNAYLADETFLNSAHATHNFAIIKQAATEQRVKLGLSANTDQQILINILKYNEDECRAYLMNKSALPDIPTPQGWGVDAPSPGSEYPFKNNSAHILPKEAIDGIKQHAAQQLILKLINKPEFLNSEQLDDLLNAKRAADPMALNLAVQAIVVGIPPAVSSSIGLDVFTPEFVEKIEKRRDALKQAAASTKFNEIVATITNDWLATQTPLLSKTPPATFLDTLLADPQFAAVKDTFKVANKEEFADTLQKKFCARYLQDKLAKEGIPLDLQKASSILNATDEATLKVALKAALPGQDVIVDQAVNADNQVALKLSVLKNTIKQLPFSDKFKAIEQASSTKKLTEGLVALLGKDGAGNDVSFDFLKPEQLEEIKGLVRDRVQVFSRDKRRQDFSDKIVDKIPSGYGKAAHKVLIDLFGQLPDDKQIELLSKENLNQVKLLLSAKTSEQIKGILGKVDSAGHPLNVDALVEENKKNALFKAIHNPHVAKALVNLGVTADKIDAVNRALAGRPADYKTLIAELHAVCGSPDKNSFYKAFNLDNTGLITDPHPVATAVVNHYRNNAIVYQRQADSTLPAEKRFEDILLRVGRPGSWTTKQDVEKAETDFAQSKNVHEFLDKLFPVAEGAVLPPKEQALKEALSRELTPTVFREIQAEKRTNIFAIDDVHKQRVIDEVNQQLTELQKSNPSIEEHAKKTARLHTVEQLQASFKIYDPSLSQSTAKQIKEIKDGYEELSAECDVTIAHLQSKLADLEASLESTKGPAPTDPEIRRKYEEMREKLEAEKILVNAQLDTYNAAKKKLAGEKGLLAVLKEFSSGTQRLQHKSLDATYKAFSRGALPPQTDPGSRACHGVSISTNRDLNYTSEKIPPNGQVLCVDMAHYKEDPSNPGQQIPIQGQTGRYIIDFHPPNADRSEQLIRENSKYVGRLWQHDELHKRHPLKAEVISVPSDPNFHAQDSIRLAMDILQHWDGKTPIKVEGDEGNEKYVAYLYYAFLEVGEHYPGFDKSKVVIGENNTAKWKPSQDKNWRGAYNSDSIRETVYKGTAKSYIAEQLSDFDALMEKRKEAATLASVSNDSATTFRDKLQKGRSDDIQTNTEKNAVVEPRDGPDLS